MGAKGMMSLGSHESHKRDVILVRRTRVRVLVGYGASGSGYTVGRGHIESGSGVIGGMQGQGI